MVLPDSKQSQERNTTIGDILALSSAALYGLYTVLLKKFVGDERKLAMRKFLGTIGVINSISLILPVFLLSHFKVEDLSPLSWKIALGLLVNGLFNMASDLLWAKAILLTSPLLASIALTVSVPLAVMADCILRGKRFGLEYLGGSALVLIGFFLVNYHDNATNAAEEEISTSIDATPREILTGSDSPDVADGFNDVGH